MFKGTDYRLSRKLSTHQSQSQQSSRTLGCLCSFWWFWVYRLCFVTKLIPGRSVYHRCTKGIHVSNWHSPQIGLLYGGIKNKAAMFQYLILRCKAIAALSFILYCSLLCWGHCQSNWSFSCYFEIHGNVCVVTNLSETPCIKGYSYGVTMNWLGKYPLQNAHTV